MQNLSGLEACNENDKYKMDKFAFNWKMGEMFLWMDSRLVVEECRKEQHLQKGKITLENIFFNLTKKIWVLDAYKEKERKLICSTNFWMMFSWLLKSTYRRKRCHTSNLWQYKIYCRDQRWKRREKYAQIFRLVLKKKNKLHSIRRRNKNVNVAVGTIIY